MKYLIAGVALLCAFSVSAETLSGHILQVRENVAYIKTTDGKKIPVILDDKTYYRKKRITKRGKKTFEIYQPLVDRKNYITLTYDPDTLDEKTGAIRASDVLVTINQD